MSGEERTVLFQLPTMISGQLICTQGTLAGRSWNLSAGTFVIGRAPGSDLTLSTEPGVSKLHAKILAEGGTYAIVDNESRNGTIVNGRPVQKAHLKTGDQIRICNCVLRFTQTGGGFGLSSAEAPPPSAASEPDFDVAAGTSPEVAEMTAAGGPPPSMEPPPSLVAPPPTPAPAASPSFVAQPSTAAAVAPTAEYQASSVELPRPAPEVRVQSALPWFAVGLVLVIVVGTGAWGGLRLFGDALLGPMPAALAANGDVAGADLNDPIARERAAEAAAKAARGDAGAAGDDDVKLAAASGDADDSAAQLDPLAEDAAVDDSAAKPDPAADSALDDAEAAADDDSASDDSVAADDSADDSEDKLADKGKAPVVTGRKAPRDTKPAPSGDGTSSGAKATGSSAGPSAWYAVVVERDGPVAVKTRAGGTVASVAASDGQSVRRGALLFSFEDAGSDEISNLRANIEALEAVAESQPSAQEMLEREQDKLKRLLAKSGDANVTAPTSGTLSGFKVKVGDTLKGGDSVGSIERGGVTLVVNVSSSDGRRIKRGGSVELKTSSGSASGRVSSVKRRGGGYQVTITTDAAPDELQEARFP